MATEASTFAMPKFYAELSASGRESMKKMMATYIDMNEKMAKGLLEWHDKATAWAKNTPWAPIFQIQHEMMSQWIDGSVGFTRKWCQLADETARKAEEMTP